MWMMGGTFLLREKISLFREHDEVEGALSQVDKFSRRVAGG
jgi:hypothetical protein